MTVDIVDNLARVKARIAQAAIQAGRDPSAITLVAVSKYVSAETVAGLVAAGHRDFGENRVQDGLAKLESIANSEVRWHLIGRLQTNKVKYISPFYLIQSLDRWDLAVKLSEYAVKKGHDYQCLIQVNVADDPAKAGIMIGEVDDFIGRVSGLAGIRIRGLMTITALDADAAQTSAWFSALAEKYNRLKGQMLPNNVQMDWLSMGMSADYELAIAAGANLVRVGSAIFTQEGD